MKELIENNSFGFTLINEDGSYGGYIYNDHDKWECNYGISYFYFDFDSRTIYEDRVDVVYVSCFFLLYGEPCYREYGIPQKTIITIYKDQIINRIHSIENGKNDENEDIENNGISIRAEYKALSIAEHVRIRETPELKSDIKVLGKLKKFQKVTVLESTNDIETIEGLQSCWHKVKTDDGIIGWVFGGFIKSYMNSHDIDLLKTAFKKEGSEYTNIFPSPDRS